MTRLSFLGAAQTVTGSRFLLESGGVRVLIDCGLFQGLKVLRLRNWAPFPVPAESVDAVVLTHAHLDHSGYLPVLVRDGFHGNVHCTPATADLTPILLADAGRLQEEDARYANRKRFTRHRPALPLFTEDDAARVTPRFTVHPFDQSFAIGKLTLRFRRAGHIIGAAGVHVLGDDVSIMFSGDVGRPADPLIPAPEPPATSDVIVMESTYGDRLHPNSDPLSVLADVVRRTIRRGGVVMIPAFAVGRAQLLLLMLHRLFEDGQLVRVPVYLNSPMAIEVGELYGRFASDHRLSAAGRVTAFDYVQNVRTVEESKALNQRRGSMIIVAGAGMLTGGRILHHLRAFGNDPRNTILLASYQAPGTRGADLLAGARSVKVHGAPVPISAEVVRLDGLSAHADQGELLSWLDSGERRPHAVYLVHGEAVPSDTLRLRVRDTLSIDAYAPEHLQTVELSGLTVHAAAEPTPV